MLKALSKFKSGGIAGVTSFGAGSCCVVPIGMMTLGLGGAGWMALMSPFQMPLYILGLVGVGGGWLFYIKKWRNCQKNACAMPAGKINGMMLSVGLLMMVVTTYFNFFVDGA